MSMTIKQAFEKLTMVCGAALKNPFFVQRNLHDAFADIAANIEEGGGGGSTVEVTPIVTEGTKIATITVDDVGTDLYAPNPTIPVHQYSTTEQVVGKWINNHDVCEIVVELADTWDFRGQGTEVPSAIANVLATATKAISCIGLSDNQAVPIALEYYQNKWSGYSSADWDIDSAILTYVK